jgi:hypothetical protein
MKAKTFGQFILEGKSRPEQDTALFWFGRETDFKKLLSKEVWCFRLTNTSKQELLGLIEELGRDLEVKVQPILLLTEDHSITLFFSIDKRLSLDWVHSWFYTTEQAKTQSADIFKSNATIVDQLIKRIGVDLTDQQLLQLASWIKDRGILSDWVEKFTLELKNHPNWPEDITDWTLGDW